MIFVDVATEIIYDTYGVPYTEMKVYRPYGAKERMRENVWEVFVKGAICVDPEIQFHYIDNGYY